MALRATLFLARPRVSALATGRNGPLMDVFLRVELAQGLAHFRCIEDGRERIEHRSISQWRETGACRLHFGNERLSSELSLDERLCYKRAVFLLFCGGPQAEGLRRHEAIALGVLGRLS